MKRARDKRLHESQQRELPDVHSVASKMQLERSARFIPRETAVAGYPPGGRGRAPAVLPLVEMLAPPSARESNEGVSLATR